MSPMRTKSFQLNFDENTEQILETIIHHDHLLFRNNGMDKETFSEWIRFLINSRISQVLQEEE